MEALVVPPTPPDVFERRELDLLDGPPGSSTAASGTAESQRRRLKESYELIDGRGDISSL